MMKMLKKGAIMKRIAIYPIIPAVLLIMSSILNAQETKSDTAGAVKGWKKSLNAGLNLTQSSFSDNWVGGDAGNLSWVAQVNGTFEKQISTKFTFRNISILQFGQTSSQDKDTKRWSRPSKSTDKIDLDNLGRFTLHTFVDPFVDFRLQSEFLDASYAPKKRLFNPVLLTESAGIARLVYQKDKNQVLTRLGFAVREKFDRAIDDTLSGTTKYKTATDGGLESVTDVTYQFASSISYIGRLSILKAFFYSKKDELKGTPQENYWKTVDFDWENTLNVNITKLVTMNFYSQLIYDKQVSLAGQFEETFGLGLKFNLY
jgi:hypothetical protein